MTGDVGLVAPYPYDARGAITLRDLGAFNELLKNVGQPGDLSGSFSLNFSGKGDTKNPTAHLQVLGDGLKYRGLLVQNVDIESKVENSLATIETGRLSLDPDNYIDFTGNAQIAEPNSYEAHGTIALKNLGVFNDLLRSLGQPGDLAGVLEVDLSGKGTVKDPTAEFRIRGQPTEIPWPSSSKHRSTVEQFRIESRTFRAAESTWMRTTTSISLEKRG